MASAGNYNVSYLDGGNWNTVYAQGFNTALGATPNPGVSNGSPVTLSKFEFFKSGNADAASNIQLAILNNIFVDMSGGLTTSNAAFVGLSTNTIASTAGIATGDPIAFDFASLPLIYGTDYAAVFVNVGTDVGNGAPLTPVLVSALTANYSDANSPGDFHPTTNYGTEGEFNYATSNFISIFGFFNTFSYAGDANFRATLSAVPEPASLTMLVVGMTGLAVRRRRA
jgi:hypothetical protein